ncbi:glycoside hydrolase family 172 protein [Gemmatimonadota bacterium]
MTRRYVPVMLTVLTLIQFFPLKGWAASASEAPVAPGLEQLYRLDRLAEFRSSAKVASVSSYDRSGGNNDGFNGEYSFVRKEPGGLVLADLKGPGVIYRIWTPTPTDDVMEFYFDGETKPRISVKFREIFMGNHPAFERPLVGCGAGGFYSYMPLAYEKSCKVVIRAETMKFYQINYATYPQSAGIKSFSAVPGPVEKENLERAKTLFSSAGEDIGTWVAGGGVEVERLKARVKLEPGKAATLVDIKQPGRIVGLRLGPASAFEGKRRDVILRAWWDGDPEPAINCPAGDFFGYAWGDPAMKSLLVGTARKVNYCYFPMPWEKSGKIELYCEPTLEKSVEVEAVVLFAPRPRQQNEGRFYSIWRRENPTTKGMPFKFIETKGRGHLVGVIQLAQGFDSGNTGYFEGDDQTTIDGELVIHGTGSEDFYNGGWYNVAGRWESRQSFVLSGCLDYKNHLGRTGGYRIFLGDAYSYRESILQTIEHAPTGNSWINDYSGVSFLYSENRPTSSFQLPSAEDRVVLDPEKIVFSAYGHLPITAFSQIDATLTKEGRILAGKRRIRYLSMRAVRKDRFGPHLIRFNCELPSAGTYRVSLDVLKGPEQGMVQLFRHEAPVAPAMDLYNEQLLRARDLHAGTLQFKEGPNDLLFKLVGHNENSSGLGFDLANIVFEKIE